MTSIEQRGAEALDKMMLEQEVEHGRYSFNASRASEAQELADRIKAQLLEALQIHPDDEAAAGFQADASAISRMINGAFWSGSQGKMFMLNHEQSLVRFVANDAFKFLSRTFGSILDRDAIAKHVEDMDFGGQEGSNEDQKRRRKFIGECLAIAAGIILDHIKYHNQRESVEWRVDMFATESRLELLEDKARIVLTHRPFDFDGTPDDKVVEDYKEHFPRFDEFLTFLVMSRFALDRKKAYLWLLADSDWGKGFLVNGILKELNARVETSVREIEAMFEGKPVGRSPEEFKRAFALVVDEFKSVKSEIKQLQSEISLAPKHQLTSSVEIFAKVFMSAESVASLVTESGVEDQFANRMSIFVENGTIEDREMFNTVGKPRYLTSLVAYAAGFMNAKIEGMQAMGRTDAQTEAERWLNGFIGRHGLDTVFERFSDSLPRVAQDVIDWLHGDTARLGDALLRDSSTGTWHLKRARVIVGQYLEEHFDRSEIGAYSKRKDEILRAMSADGKGSINHRLNGKQTKTVVLNPASTFWPSA